MILLLFASEVALIATIAAVAVPQTAVLGPIGSVSTWVLAIVGLMFGLPIGFGLCVWFFPVRFTWLFFWCYFKLFYRIETHGLENVPKTGGALLAPNHMSWLDGFLVQFFTPRHVCTLVYAGNFEASWVKRLGEVWKAILISANPKSIIRALRQASQYLNDGEVVCIFPEGGISRSAQVQTFKPGMMKILKNTDAPVIPMYFDGLWGSIFSFSGGKFFWKMPTLGRRKIDIYYGKPLKNVTDATVVRNAVTNLGAVALQKRKQEMVSVSDALIRSCKKRKSKLC